MARRVGICAVAQTTYQRRNEKERFQGMALGLLESLLGETGLDFAEDTGINHIITVSDDVFDARTISDNGLTDVVGGHFRAEEKIAQEGIQAIYYGLAMVGSGHADVVLVMGHCKESQPASRNMVTHLAFDPFYGRPVGLDYLAAAGMQAQAYLASSKVSEDQLADVVVQARKDAAANRHTSEVDRVTREEVLASPLIADPIRELHSYPVSDGAVGLILASEERAKKLTDKPVWVSGVGNCMDRFFLGDRDLKSNFSLKNAARRAYARAGIGDPSADLDVVELSDQYAYQRPMWLEGLGLAETGRGGDYLAKANGAGPRLNPSGGMLAGNPLLLGGLVRAAEAAQQLRGEAGEHQVDGARTALAHGVMGPAGQFHSVAILNRD